MMDAAGLVWRLRQASPVDPGVWHARLMSDPRFRAEMRFCSAAGIAHSTFLGWPAEDQDKALAWQMFAGERCGSCGFHPDEWDENDPQFEVEGHRCFGCQALGQFDQEMQTAAEDGQLDMAGLQARFRARRERGVGD